MSFKVTFNQEEKIYNEPVTILDIVGNDTDIVCAYVNHYVRELTYTIDKDCEIIPLTCKDRDAKPIYEASLRYLVAMAMHNIHPELQIRFAYNVSRSIFMQILNQGTSASGIMMKELIEMNRLVSKIFRYSDKLCLKKSLRASSRRWLSRQVDILIVEKNRHISAVATIVTICITAWFIDWLY